MTSLLSERAVLVRPSISVWRGEITDRAASAETANRYRAEDRSVRTTKFLIAKEALDPILTEANAIRAFVRQETLPWRWDGVGLLPTDNYLPFMDGWRQHRAAFDGAVAALLRHWHFHVAVGQRALGDLASEYDYPERDQVAGRFSAAVEILPVPDAQDFRAQVTEAEAERIRESLAMTADAELAQAQSYLWEQMAEAVERIKLRLSEYQVDPAGKVLKGRLHDSLIGNLRLLVDRLARLNISQDPAIDAMRMKLAASLCPVEVDELRSSEPLRASVADEAARLMEMMSGFYERRAA